MIPQIFVFIFLICDISASTSLEIDNLPKSIVETDDVPGLVGRTKRAAATTSPTCTKEYKEIPDHTMCLPDNPDATTMDISAADKTQILEMHNLYRGNANPPAAGLMKLGYDEQLAKVAQKWASQCVMGHDSVKKIPGYGLGVGQNVAGGYLSWGAAIEAWHNETKDYIYGKDPRSYLGADALKLIGHYTQIVCNRTSLLGCGAAYCEQSKYKWYYVCNYQSGQTDAAHPYETGPTCSKCPNQCIDGVCDCGGLMCFNGGTLDPDTCTCKCYDIYKGETCEKLVCPARDKLHCGRVWPKTYCKQFGNVPYECPHMCGVCGDGNVKEEKAFTSAAGCIFKGARDDLQTCKKYGDQGQDKSVCMTKGGRMKCGECQRYSNLMTDFCPVMCGLCDAPCGGKPCKNGGRLNVDTCECQCKKPYKGKNCENLVCPETDRYYCRRIKRSFCEMYSNVPTECPYKCGICK